MKAELVTKSEYAKRRGCAPSAVTRAIQEGRITIIVKDGKDMIDPAVADIQWQRNTRARADSRSATGAAPPPSADGLDPKADSRGGEKASDQDYWASRARREKAEANLAELKLQEQLGELVRAADVRAAVAAKASALREGLLQIPARLAAVLAAETDQGKVHDTLRDELRQALEVLTATSEGSRG